MSAPQGNASSGSSATGSGSIAQTTLSALSGVGSGYSNVSGGIANTQIVAVTGYVYTNSNVTSNIDIVVFTAPNGNAIGTGGASSVKVISIKLQKQNRTIDVSKQDRTIIL